MITLTVDLGSLPGYPLVFHFRRRVLQASGCPVWWGGTMQTVPGFRERYLEELQDRGFSIWPSGPSAYGVDLPRTTGYDIRAIQETTLRPYTVRYKRVWQRDDPNLWRLRWNARHPVSVSGRSVVVRLPAEFQRPWKTVILVPDQNLVEPPFPLPLPPSRSEEHTSELQSRENLVCRLLLEKKKKIINIFNSLKKKKKIKY